MNMLIGKIPGTIGETSVIAIIIGAIFLILVGAIDLRIPGTYIVTFVIFVGIFGHFTKAGVGFFDPQYITAHLCGGGLMLGAWFMLLIMSHRRLRRRDSMYTEPAGYTDRIVPSLWRLCGRRILCNHHQ